MRFEKDLAEDERDAEDVENRSGRVHLVGTLLTP